MALFEKVMTRVGRGRCGQTMTEYVLILAAVALTAYVAYQALAGGINDLIQTTITALKAA